MLSLWWLKGCQPEVQLLIHKQKGPFTCVLQNMLCPHYCNQIGSSLEYVCFLKRIPVQLGTGYITTPPHTPVTQYRCSSSKLVADAVRKSNLHTKCSPSLPSATWIFKTLNRAIHLPWWWGVFITWSEYYDWAQQIWWWHSAIRSYMASLCNRICLRHHHICRAQW